MIALQHLSLHTVALLSGKLSGLHVCKVTAGDKGQRSQQFWVII